MERNAEAEKPDLKQLALRPPAADTKNHVQLFERSEETIYDRRELTEGLWRDGVDLALGVVICSQLIRQQ